MKYETVRADYEYLVRIVEVTDCTPFMDNETINLMETPTKKQASTMYRCGIMAWFDEHGDEEFQIDQNNRIAEILDRHE